MQEATMKAKGTLVFAIFFLTTLAGGLGLAQAAPAGAGDCAAQIQVAPPMTSLVELQIPAAVPLTGKDPGQNCLSFCAIVSCPVGICGPKPEGGCGCLEGIGDVLEPGN
jgi:hypothetical protein